MRCLRPSAAKAGSARSTSGLTPDDGGRSRRRPLRPFMGAELPMDFDGLGNRASGDVDPESDGRGSCLFDDRVTVHAAGAA